MKSSKARSTISNRDKPQLTTFLQYRKLPLMEKQPHPVEGISDQMIVVPPSSLQRDTLVALAREFLLRQAQNESEIADCSAQSIERVIKALHRSEAHITFDRHTESVGVISAVEFEALSKSGNR
jgi:uncharacterized protein YheU (UPF0270 family)